MKLQNKNGFTLIELLVVITIIGILATGATATYTSQIQKARDTTRINDVKAIQSSVEQSYQDHAEYPDNTVVAFSWVLRYMDKYPVDTKDYQPSNTSWWAWSDCLWYTYIAWADWNWILLWNYEISTWFEANWNMTKANSDALWTTNDLNRLEIWTVSWTDFMTSCVGTSKSVADFAQDVIHIKTTPEVWTRWSPTF